MLLAHCERSNDEVSVHDVRKAFDTTSSRSLHAEVVHVEITEEGAWSDNRCIKILKISSAD